VYGDLRWTLSAFKSGCAHTPTLTSSLISRIMGHLISSSFPDSVMPSGDPNSSNVSERSGLMFKTSSHHQASCTRDGGADQSRVTLRCTWRNRCHGPHSRICSWVHTDVSLLSQRLLSDFSRTRAQSPHCRQT
jgi:hypothetical protein